MNYSVIQLDINLLEVELTVLSRFNLLNYCFLFVLKLFLAFFKGRILLFVRLFD